MEAILVSATIMTTIILSFIGLIKLPFKSFKEKHPKWYRAIFTILSLLLPFGLCLINQEFILAQPLFDFNFFVMLFATYVGVFITYNGVYEGLGVKDLFKKLFSAIGTAIKSAVPDSKVNKLVKKYGLDKIEASIIAVKTKQEEAAKVEQVVAENPVVENTEQSVNAQN